MSIEDPNHILVRVVVDGVESRCKINAILVRNEIDKAVDTVEQLAWRRMAAGDVEAVKVMAAMIRNARVEVLRRFVGDAVHRCMAHVVDEMVPRE